MKSSNISFYFVLYLVAIITVFVITSERDQLLRQRDEDIAHLIEVYVKPLHLTAYVDTARFFVSPNEQLTSEPVKVRVKADGPMDRDDIAFTIVSAHTADGGSIDSRAVRAVNESGDGVLITPPLEPGLYEFTVAGYKRRVISDGTRMKVSIRDTTYEVQYSKRLEKVDRDTVTLLARVEKSGIAPPQLTLSVPDANDAWVVGPPFTKKIFVGGVQDVGGVSFAPGGSGRIERSAGAPSYVTFVWDRPTLGRHTFAVTADARRGLGPKDRAQIGFAVQVFPATFSTPPAGRGYWGIPYVFDGQIAGLNPLDVAVDVSHDGQTLHTKPVLPRDTLIPQRSWNSLAFKVLYKGSIIKEHRVPLEMPPPPQIRWVQQNLDRTANTFVITAESTDPIGGPVKLSLQSEPSGIATMDRIRGTRFRISIDLRNKPPAVFLKLTATDQFGGQSVSSKQFNIPR
jgi:hypothetical protein